MRIDDKSVVPLGWVLGGFATMISISAMGAFWIATVNFRLQRIEEKLNIPLFQNNAAFLPNEKDGHGRPTEQPRVIADLPSNARPEKSDGS